MNIRSRIAQLEKQGHSSKSKAEVKAQLEKILQIVKSTPPMELEPDSIYWLPPSQCLAGEIFMALFEEYGVSIV